MCGIAGFLDLRRATADGDLEATVRRMADTLAHRGPDGAGAWTDAAAGAALGHRRLSIVDLSDAGRQPMVSADGRLVIVYNGLVYNFAELRAELEAAGARFRGYCDTEIILEAMAAWGIGPAVRRFIGMFAFAVWDRRERKLHLVRDRLGIKPLYYGRFGDTFGFASELRGIRAHPAFAGELDTAALTLFMQRGCVPGPRSIFAGVRKLPPGCHLVVDPAADREAEPAPYWSLREVAETGVAAPFSGSEADASAQLEDLLRDAVRRRLVADVPVGLFLSGGIDSSLVTALARAESGAAVKTFSIGFRDGGYDEAQDAAAVARHLGTDHHELYVSPDDALAVIPRLPAIYDEPFADSSQIPTYLVSALARREVTVALSGDGGDELFGGYNRYLGMAEVGRRVERWPAAARRAAGVALTLLSPDRWDAVFARLPRALRLRNPGDKLHKLAAVIEGGDLPGMYARLFRTWPNAERLVRGGGEPATPITDRTQWARLPDFVDQMMHLDAVTYLPDDILAKVDRAAMAVALEARVPLLDHRVVEFAWRLPQTYKLRGRLGKIALRRILYRHVPQALVDRPKMGFAVPIHTWLRGPLRDWAEALLAEDRLVRENVFDPAPIRRAWADHLSGRRNRQHELWNVLMFQAWHETMAA